MKTIKLSKKDKWVQKYFASHEKFPETNCDLRNYKFNCFLTRSLIWLGKVFITFSIGYDIPSYAGFGQKGMDKGKAVFLPEKFFFNLNGSLLIDWNGRTGGWDTFRITAPLYDQVLEWFRTKKIFISIVSDEDEMHTARINAFGLLYLGNRSRNYEQVQVECIRRAIKTFKEKNKKP